MLLIFLLLSILTGLFLIISAVALFVAVYFGKTNGLSWALAFVTLESGVAFIGLPLTVLYQRLLFIGIIGFLHFWLTFGIFTYRLFYGHNATDNTETQEHSSSSG